MKIVNLCHDLILIVHNICANSQIIRCCCDNTIENIESECKKLGGLSKSTYSELKIILAKLGFTYQLLPYRNLNYKA